MRETESYIDNASDDGLAVYLKQIGRYKLLTAAEEIELAREAQAGSKRARTKLVESNLRLVVSIAKRYRGRGLAMDDLIQEGNIGLMRGIDRFDPGRGCRLSTYVTWWIRQAMVRALMEKVSPIRLPERVQQMLQKIQRRTMELAMQLGREPDRVEVAAACDMTPTALELAAEAEIVFVPLDMPVGDTGLVLHEVLKDEFAIPPEDATAMQMMKESVARALRVLPKEEAAVLQLKYGLGRDEDMTVREVAAVVGVSQTQVRRLEERAFEKLRRSRELVGWMVA